MEQPIFNLQSLIRNEPLTPEEKTNWSKLFYGNKRIVKIDHTSKLQNGDILVRFENESGEKSVNINSIKTYTS